MSTYARDTKVTVDRSRTEIEKTLTRYGATGFGYSWERHEVPVDPPPLHGAKTELREFATLVFHFKARRVRLDIPMPSAREVGGSEARVAKAARQRWRAVLLVIKAKLEAVESGISTFEAEFLANIVTQSGRTVGEIVLPRMADAVEKGLLLPAATDARP